MTRDLEVWKSNEAVHSLPGQGPADWFTGVVRIDSPFIAIQEQLDGKAVDWMEKVSDVTIARTSCVRASHANSEAQASRCLQ